MRVADDVDVRPGMHVHPDVARVALQTGVDRVPRAPSSSTL